MAHLRGKGTILQQTIATVLTDVAQITDLTLSGEASLDSDGTELNGGVYEVKDLTGFSSPGTVEAGLFFDPALAGHQAIVALIESPATCVWKLKYSDSGPSTLTFTSAGVGLDQKIVANDGLRGTLKMNRTGAPTRA